MFSELSLTEQSKLFKNNCYHFVPLLCILRMESFEGGAAEMAQPKARLTLSDISVTNRMNSVSPVFLSFMPSLSPVCPWNPGAPQVGVSCTTS